MKNVKQIAIVLMAGIVLTGCDWNGKQTIAGTGDISGVGNVTAVTP